MFRSFWQLPCKMLQLSYPSCARVVCFVGWTGNASSFWQIELVTGTTEYQSLVTTIDLKQLISRCLKIMDLLGIFVAGRELTTFLLLQIFMSTFFILEGLVSIQSPRLRFFQYTLGWYLGRIWQLVPAEHKGLLQSTSRAPPKVEIMMADCLTLMSGLQCTDLGQKINEQRIQGRYFTFPF